MYDSFVGKIFGRTYQQDRRGEGRAIKDSRYQGNAQRERFRIRQKRNG